MPVFIKTGISLGELIFKSFNKLLSIHQAGNL